MLQLNENQIKQIKLAAFGSCTKYGPDGMLGNAYQNAEKLFREKVPSSSQNKSIDEIDLSSQFEKDFKCPCGECDGFGHGWHEGEYRVGKPEIEAYYQYEYPNISLITKWAAYGIMAMYPELEWGVSSGYRCYINNKRHGRTSTNHMGKSLDIYPKIDDIGDREWQCDKIRKELVESGVFQIGWKTSNKLSLEPGRHDSGYSFSAPTWIHVDCRCFDRKWITATTEY